MSHGSHFHIDIRISKRNMQSAIGTMRCYRKYEEYEGEMIV